MTLLKSGIGKLDFELPELKDFAMSLTWYDSSSNYVDITSYSAEMQIREDASDTSSSALITLSYPNSGISINHATSTVTVNIPKEVNTFGDRQLVHDIVFTKYSGDKFTWLAGTVFSIGAVTK